MRIKNIAKKWNIIFLIAALLLLAGCPGKNDAIYPVTQEEYLIGFVLHNINDSTPTTVSYSKNELALYNYSYNYPANMPRTYDNIMFWIAPFQWIAGSEWVRLAVPQDRIYYLKGDNVSEKAYWNRKWDFMNYMGINYMISNDSAIQFGLDVSSEEHYKSESSLDVINPMPGQKEHIYFGTSPYIPASIIVRDIGNNNFISLNSHLLSGYGGKSYVTRNTKIVIWIYYFENNTFEEKIIELPAPTYKIYYNKILAASGNLTTYNQWDHGALLYYLRYPGFYEIEINIPSFYPVFNTTIIKANVTKTANKTNYTLPVLKHIEFPPRFELNKPIPIYLQFENKNDITKVMMYYKTNAMKQWNKFGNYKGTNLIIRNPKATEINFKFEAFTKDGASSYEIYPISLRGVGVFCNNTLSLSKDKNTMVSGKCTDNLNKPVGGLRVELYSGAGEFLGAVMTSITGMYGLEVNKSIKAVKAIFNETGVYKGVGSKSTFQITCGNGVIEQGEQCDDGVNNGFCPSKCSMSCDLNDCADCPSSSSGGGGGGGGGNSGEPILNSDINFEDEYESVVD